MISQERYAIQFLAWLTDERVEELKAEDPTVLWGGETHKVPKTYLEEGATIKKEELGTFQKYVIIRRNE